MLIDLNEWRPQNETQEHFFLKQVGRAYLFKQGIRCIATEVDYLNTNDNPPFGTPKIVIDVLGINKKDKPHVPTQRLKEKIEERALIIGEKRGLTYETKWSKNGLSFLSPYDYKDKEERTKIEAEISLCHAQACEELGYHRDMYKHVHLYSEETYEIRGIEVKVSYSDFRNGFNMLPEYTYVLAPKGIVPKEELPAKVGLLEFDFDAFHSFVEEGKDEAWFSALSVAKRPKKTYDSQFMIQKNKKSYFDRENHARFCQRLLFRIAQQNTEEHIFWNPHLQQLNKMILNKFVKTSYPLEIGQSTPFGKVIDRRYGQYTYKEGEQDPNSLYNKKRAYMPYYKFVSSNGISKWIPQLHVANEFIRVQKELIQEANDYTSLHQAYELFMKSVELGYTWYSVQHKRTLFLADIKEYSNVEELSKDLRLQYPSMESKKHPSLRFL